MRRLDEPLAEFVPAIDLDRLSEWSIAHVAPHLIGFRIGPSLLSDPVAHLNNVAILQLVDRAAEDHLDRFGWTRRAMAAEGVMWFVARHEIDYRAEAFAGDELVAATWIESFGRTTCLRSTQLRRLGDDRLVAEAISRWVHIDLASRRPRRIAEELRLAMPPRLSEPDRRDANPRVD
ncbi:MAG: acyl-CoA thioesterase [Phycisphaerales bacterium]